MSPSIIEQVKDAIAPLADKVSQGAEFMYSVFYRQTINEALLMIILPSILIVAGGIALRFWVPYAQRRRQEIEKSPGYNDGEGWSMALYFSVIVYVILLPPGGGAIIDGALRLANPHYYTINRVIQSVKAKEIR